MSSLAILLLFLFIATGLLWIAGLIPTILDGIISFITALGSNIWLLIIFLFVIIALIILTRPKVLKGLGIGAGGVGVAVAGSAAASKLGSMKERLDSDERDSSRGSAGRDRPNVGEFGSATDTSSTNRSDTSDRRQVGQTSGNLSENSAANNSSQGRSNISTNSSNYSMSGSGYPGDFQLLQQLQNETGKSLELDQKLAEDDKTIQEALHEIATLMNDRKDLIQILENSKGPAEAANKMGEIQDGRSFHDEVRDLNQAFAKIAKDIKLIEEKTQEEEEILREEENIDSQEEQQEAQLEQHVNKIETIAQKLGQMHKSSW